jgi:NAD(P)-dependent dehydrogenase (short-subunit alcohol dehydrogenase family)
MRRLEGRVCIVTGAARGIGRAVARAFVAEGAIVYGADWIADELGREMVAIGARAVPTDLTQAEQIEWLVRTVVREQSRVDVLANVAGVIEIKRLEETSLEDFDRILSVNLRGPFLTCKAVAPHMKEAGRGSIINVSSRAGVMGFADEVAYCASKFGLEGLSRAIAEDLGPHGIAVNTITPGVPTHTAMSEKTYSTEARRIWKDPLVITPAFVHLALQTSRGIHNRYVNAWELSQQLQAEGWEA